MFDNLTLTLTVCAVTLLAGLGFAILVKIFVASEIERWFGKKSISENVGAPEGDDRHFRKY
jgi:hypothetical protein